MIITKMALPRRTFLRGMGATVALPLLDAMVPALSATSRRRPPLSAASGSCTSRTAPSCSNGRRRQKERRSSCRRSSSRSRRTGSGSRWCRTSIPAPRKPPKAKAQGIMRAQAPCGCRVCIRSAPRARTCAAGRRSIRWRRTCSGATPSFARWRSPRKTLRPWAAAISATPAAT